MILSVDSVRLKVSTAQLRAKSEEVKKYVDELKKNMDSLERKVNGTKTYWIGEAGDLHRRLYNEQKDEIDQMLRRLSEHPRDLITIADAYDGVEREVEELANQLIGDIIE